MIWSAANRADSESNNEGIRENDEIDAERSIKPVEKDRRKTCPRAR
jgi:hypothetical protein